MTENIGRGQNDIFAPFCKMLVMGYTPLVATLNFTIYYES